MRNSIKVMVYFLMAQIMFTQCNTASLSTTAITDTDILNSECVSPETIYYSDDKDHAGVRIFTISADTLCLYSLIPNFPYIKEYDRKAMCKMTHHEGNFYEINSIDVAWENANRNVYVEYDTIGSPQPYISIVLKFPNYISGLTVDASVDFKYKRYAENNGEVEYKINRISADMSSWYIQPEEFDVINIRGEYFGIIRLYGSLNLFFPELKESYELSRRVNKITITYPTLSPETFSEYYLTGQYIKITPKSIFWNGEEYHAIDKKRLAGCEFISPNDTIQF